MRIFRRLLAAFLLVVTIASGRAQDWDAADKATKRLAPSAFTDLPAVIQKELVRRECTIPQPFTATRPENVIRGRFTSATQTEWAVLCSIRRTSSILVFRNGFVSRVVELSAEPDINSLQGIGNGVVGYSRALGVADAKFIRDHYERYGGPKPPTLDHDGINDISIEKGSLVWYWDRGRWLRLTGSD
jgi:hypothetical protein